MKKRDLLLQAGLGGSLHLSPGEFKGCNFYLRTMPMLVCYWSAGANFVTVLGPWTPLKFPLIHLLHALI